MGLAVDDEGAIALARDVLAAVGLSPQPPPSGASRDVWESLAALVALAGEMASAHEAATLTDLVDELRLMVFPVVLGDGKRLEYGPGSVMVVPAGHDAWVVGDEAELANLAVAVDQQRRG